MLEKSLLLLFRSFLVPFYLSLGLLFAAKSAAAESVKEFYDGKSISIIVFTGTGGAFDTYARLLARTLPKYMPSQPTAVVRNMPGGGGITAARFLADVAPKDGTTIGALSKTLIFEPLLGSNVAKVDYLKFGWLGSMSQSTTVYISWHTSAVKTVQDLFYKELLIPGTGAGAETTIITQALNGILGTKFKLVQGYPGTVEAILSLERGETYGNLVTLETVIMLHPHWLKENKINYLFQLRRIPDPRIADVPTVMSLAQNDMQMKALELLFPLDVFGRPYVVPPGTPPDRLAALQKAFSESINDPELIAQANKLGIPVYLSHGEDQAQVVRETYAALPEVVQFVRKAIASH